MEYHPRFNVSQKSGWLPSPRVLRASIVGVFMIIALVLLSSCSQSGSSSGSGSTGSAPPNSTAARTGAAEPLSMLHMFSTTNGWALSPNAVLQTTDGGQHWKTVSPPNASITQDTLADFFSATTAWIALPPSTNNIERVFGTTNGGQSWTPWSFTVSAGITSGGQLFFADPQNGWLLAPTAPQNGSEAVILYRTTNGGSTWREVTRAQPISPPPTAKLLPFAGDKTGVTFISPTTGWITGSVTRNDFAWFYMTHDGGSTWQLQSLSLPSSATNAQITTLPPTFFSSSDGILPVVIAQSNGQRYADFYQTHDGGNTWSGTSTLPLSSVIDSFINVNQGWATDDVGLYTTQNGGQQWTRLNPNMSFKGVTHLDFVSDQVGWAISGVNNGSPFVLHTSDGGKTWAQLSYTVGH